MSSSRLRLADRLLKVLAACFVVVIVLLPFHAFFSTWGGTAIGPLLAWKSWKEILLVALIPVVTAVCRLRPDIKKRLMASKLNWVILAYTALTLVMTIVSTASSEAAIAGLLMNLRFLAMFMIGELLLFSGAKWIEPLKKWLAAWLVFVGVLLGGLAILQITVIPKDFLTQFGYNKETTIAPYILVDEDPNALRAFATMRGPNTLGAYLLLPLAIALLMWWQNRRAWWLLGAAGLMTLGLLLTGSRSAWLGAGAMALVLAWVTLPRDKIMTWLKFGTIPALLLAGFVFWLATTVPVLRLALFHSGGAGQNESLTEGSSDKHVQATLDGIHTAVTHPLGIGVGAAGPASFYNAGGSQIPENYYVQIAEEVGLFGLVLFAAINLHIGRRLWQQKQLLPRALVASFIGIGVINLFLHGWADDPTAMTWWGLAGLFIAKQK